MKLQNGFPLVVGTILMWLLQPVVGERLIKSNALLSCMENSEFTASKFDVVFFPDNSSVNLDVRALSTIYGNITAEISVVAYGYTAIKQKIVGCDLGVGQLCPISPGHFDVQTNQKLDSDIVKQIPGIAFTIPDLDGIVRVEIYNSNSTTPVACVEATLSNGKTVQTKYASWAIAAVCMLGLLTAGGVSLAGYQSTASHIASNVVSLFVYFQSVAIISMMAVERLPPIAAGWAQNFMWTMGLIRVGFLEKIFTWYVQSTGGTSTNVLINKDIISTSVQKRDLSAKLHVLHDYSAKARDLLSGEGPMLKENIPATSNIVPRAVEYAGRLVARSNVTDPVTSNEKDPGLGGKTLVLRGIQRVAYLANIEITNLFLTGIVFFFILTIFCILMIAAAKQILELLVMTNTIASDRFIEFRSGWRVTTKGLLYRLMLICFQQLSLLCLWELTVRDSVATVILGIVTYLIVLCVLGFGTFKVITIAQRSLELYQNPAYILYSDTKLLNKLGFLYVQLRATAYWFIMPLLIYSFCKAAFIALAQPSGKTQAMAVFLIELAYLVGVSWVKPYMDKTTNGFNIGISAINFVNALFFLFFSNLFGQPEMVGSIMGVVFFILNAVFSLVLLIMIIISCVWALLAKNPDTRYQPMKDDRESFIPDLSNHKTRKTELDALGATMRDGFDPEMYSLRGDRDLESPTSEQFPQARLSRKSDVHLNVISSNNYSSSSVDLVSSGGRDSPGFPQATAYKGYHATEGGNWNR